MEIENLPFLFSTVRTYVSPFYVKSLTRLECEYCTFHYGKVRCHPMRYDLRGRVLSKERIEFGLGLKAILLQNKVRVNVSLLFH